MPRRMRVEKVRKKKLRTRSLVDSAQGEAGEVSVVRGGLNEFRRLLPREQSLQAGEDETIRRRRSSARRSLVKSAPRSSPPFERPSHEPE